MKILMLCLGNICRSPLAEGILQEKARQAGLNWQIDSAGTNGYHTGEAPHRLSQKVALAHGIDISHQRARNFIAADLDQYDLLFAMANDVLEDMKRISRRPLPPGKVDLLLNVAFPGMDYEVPDPWSGPESDYREAFDLIEQGCEAVLRKYANIPHPSTEK